MEKGEEGEDEEQVKEEGQEEEEEGDVERLDCGSTPSEENASAEGSRSHSRIWSEVHVVNYDNTGNDKVF